MMTSDDLELDLLLKQLGKQGFVNHEMRINRIGPDVVGFVHPWRGGIADVVVLHDERRACAWRTASGPDVDVFAPVLVSWWYVNSPVWTLRAVLVLPQPGDPDEPLHLGPYLMVARWRRMSAWISACGCGRADETPPTEPGSPALPGRTQ